MKYPAPTRRAHQTFCTTEGWTRRKTATGKNGTHHVNYELALLDGRILLTRISHPINKETYGASRWSHILRDQLDVDEPAFWTCVQEGVKPARGQAPVPREALPVGLVMALISVGVDEDEIRSLSKEEAAARLAQEYSKPPP